MHRIYFRCNDYMYSGQYCQHCPTCPTSEYVCEKMLPCVHQIYETMNMVHVECKTENRTSDCQTECDDHKINIHSVEDLPGLPKIIHCSYTSDYNCTGYYGVDIDPSQWSLNDLYLRSVSDCPPPVPVFRNLLSKLASGTPGFDAIMH